MIWGIKAFSILKFQTLFSTEEKQTISAWENARKSTDQSKLKLPQPLITVCNIIKFELQLQITVIKPILGALIETMIEDRTFEHQIKSASLFQT